jgi:MerR family mercuric resistance operon transcriptional regulator
MQRLTTGRLATRAEVNPQTIRYYEREGILQPSRRSPSGYRIFSEDAVHRIRFVKQAQTLGFSLREIQELLSMRPEKTGKECANVKRLAREKITEIDRKIGALAEMRFVLQQLDDQCPGSGPLSECPILGTLDREAHSGSQRDRNHHGKRGVLHAGRR